MTGALQSFDLPLSLYTDDVADIAGRCIERYGEAEWRAVVLTHEIHGHLGIYSMLGAKMGTRAVEIFRERGLRGAISACSSAGGTPPVSCLNDGIQVSTGASMGHGTFAVSTDGPTAPRARFSCLDASLELCLKPDYEQRIRSDIQSAVARYGHAPAYWDCVRRLAIHYWQDWDRAEIFSITDCPCPHAV